MLVRIAYVMVIAIWATTPLAIKLGGDSLPPMAGLSLRILLAFMVGSICATLVGYKGLNIKRHWQLYLAGSISLFPNMALVYFAAQYISSGLIALLFGLSPFFTVVLAKPILGENLLHPRKLFAILLAFFGLVCIFMDGAALSKSSVLGISLMLVSNIIFASSALWLKRLNNRFNVDPLEQTLGAMAFALPSMGLFWFFVVGFEPLHFSLTSTLSLLYLALFGSLIGFVAYYFILKSLSVEAVSLIPFITPVLAMTLGAVVANEQVSTAMALGALLILVALGIHQAVWKSFYRLAKKAR